jgi:hypothetical protein
MNRNVAAISAQGAGFVAILFFAASAFNVLPGNIALFLGFASALAAGFLWMIRGRLKE